VTGDGWRQFMIFKWKISSMRVLPVLFCSFLVFPYSVLAGIADSLQVSTLVPDSVQSISVNDSTGVSPAEYPICSFTPTPEVNGIRLGIIGGALLTTTLIINYYQRNAWWLGERAPFHFQNDWKYALNVDKVGHVYATTAAQYIFQKSFEWSGVSESKAVWYGAGLALLFELYIETQDGFHKEWGFSPGDAMGDAVGALYPVLQHYVPPLKNVKFKWSYWPSNELREGKKQMFIDDYQGQTYWISLSFYDWLPKSMQSWWPPFLGIAGGFAARNLNGGGSGERQYFIALDYDLTKLPGDSWILKTLKESGNFFHFPAPALRITPTATFFVLYF
jgi:hypothetical protein